jgi:hypothetical protein
MQIKNMIPFRSARLVGQHCPYKKGKVTVALSFCLFLLFVGALALCDKVDPSHFLTSLFIVKLFGRGSIPLFKQS